MRIIDTTELQLWYSTQKLNMLMTDTPIKSKGNVSIPTMVFLKRSAHSTTPGLDVPQTPLCVCCVCQWSRLFS